LYSQTYSTAEIRSIINRDRLKIAFIDSLGLIKSIIDSPYRRVSQIITDLKQCAKDKGVIFVIIHHLSRKESQSGNDGAEPVKLSHLRDSGKLEELIDFCIGVYRPELAFSGEEKWRDVLVAELIKNRRGKLNHINCHFNKTSGQIREQDERIN
jgi:replicative DNA helicase